MIASVLYGAFVLLSLFIGYFFIYSVILSRRYKHIPGPKPLPLIGNVLQLGTTALELKHKLVNLCIEYNGFFKLHLGPTRVYVIVTNPKDVETILSSQIHTKKSHDYNNFFHDWLGDGLLISNGKKWKQRRRILTPAFHFSIFEKFIDVFDKAGNVLIRQLSKEVDGSVFDVQRYICLCALDIICGVIFISAQKVKPYHVYDIFMCLETSMGVSVNAQEKSNSQYVRAVRNLCSIIHERMFSLPKQFEFLFKLTSAGRLQNKSLKILHDMTASVIIARRNHLVANDSDKTEVEDTGIYGKKRCAFLDVLLKSTIDGKPLSNEEIREEVDTFMFEGHDTVSSAICFALHEISHNKEVQDKIFKEVRLLLPEKDTVITSNMLREMKYLELVIKETLRLYPSVPIVARHISHEFDLNGKKVPPGYLAVGIFMTHRDPEHFPEPEEFIPERFLEERYNSNAFSYTPFSAGPRNCIGQKFAMLEMKSVLSKIIRSYEILPGTNNRELDLEIAIILKAPTGFNIKLRQRE